MRCRKPDGTYTIVTMKYFYPRCSRIRQALGICNGLGGAYVAAITVCRQRLTTGNRYLLPSESEPVVQINGISTINNEDLVTISQENLLYL